jgi:CheY-like chemotaxis protein
MSLTDFIAEHWGQIAGAFGTVGGVIVGAVGLRKAVATQRTAEAKAEEKISTRLMGRVEKLEGRIDTITKQRDDVTGQFGAIRIDLNECMRKHESAERGHRECLDRAEKTEARQRVNDEATVALLSEVERLCTAIDIPRESVDRVSIAKIKLRSLTPRSLEAQRGTVVLVVDDDDVVLRSLLRLVDSAGHTPMGASNATQALSILAENRVDVVLCDVVMPGQSGPDLAATMRESGLATPVIFVTGQPGARAPGVLEKPVTLADLQLAIGAALRT